ncbi:MAG: DNA-binding protein [Thermoprotei archaeon]|nr:MAG: DNA-binding protein [Thermoprotei archaeon]RLE90255.1 MAG: DNA-binding protein [Thermoprotei archaeon]
MSFKPVFAYQILEGRKAFELRKKIFTIKQGDRIIMYASNPVKAIVGEFIAGEVIVGEFSTIWEYVKAIPSSGVDERDIPYIRGHKHVLAIKVVKPKKYKRAITLKDMRSLIPNWRPPLSYMRVKGRLRDILMKLIDLTECR